MSGIHAPKTMSSGHPLAEKPPEKSASVTEEGALLPLVSYYLHICCILFTSISSVLITP